MQERGTGVFGIVKDDDDENQSYDSLQPVSEDNPNTIYKLLFEEFDKENGK